MYTYVECGFLINSSPKFYYTIFVGLDSSWAAEHHTLTNRIFASPMWQPVLCLQSGHDTDHQPPTGAV